MAALCPLSLTPVFYNGALAVGARAFVYDAGGITPRTTYSDAGLTTPNTNPIVVPGSGRVPKIFVQGNPYKVRFETSGGLLIEEVDGIPADTGSSSSGGGSGGGTGSLVTGDTLWSYATGPRVGFARLNGRSIGTALSGASEIAGTTAHDLFVFLWNADPLLTVSGGRGSSAEADWLANKTINLPDARFAALRGLDDMGNTPANRAAGVPFTVGTGTALGALCGASTHALTTAQLASHTHTGSTDAVAGHTHTGSAGIAGSHNHGGATANSGVLGMSGSTDVQGQHTHTYDLAPQRFGSVGAGGDVGGIWSGGDGAGDTFPAGFHSHGVNVSGANHSHGINADGSHTHTIATDTAGGHAHNLTTAAAGSGSAHNNVGPSLLGTWYIRL